MPGRVGVFLLAVGLIAACGSDSATGSDGLRIVATTSILGDITSEVVGEGNASVETIMPAGGDPHEFAATARQAEAMLQADLLVVNGGGFEEGLLDLVEQAEDAGVEVFTFTDHLDVMESDPHFWTDPTRVADAVEALGEAAGDLDGVDAAEVGEHTDAYLDELTALDGEIESVLADIPEERRVLVTNHEVFGYFADRYGFEVIGAVIPSLSTHAEPSQAQLEELAGLVEEHELPAIFGETSHAGEEAESVSQEVGGVEVVALYSESLGEEGSGADTYLGMMRTNADLIAEALS